MKRVLIVVILVVAAAVLGLWRTHGGVRNGLSRAVGVSNDDAQRLFVGAQMLSWSGPTASSCMATQWGDGAAQSASLLQQ